MSDPSMRGAAPRRDEPREAPAAGRSSNRALVVWLLLVLAVLAGVALYWRYGRDVTPLLP